MTNPTGHLTTSVTSPTSPVTSITSDVTSVTSDVTARDLHRLAADLDAGRVDRHEAAVAAVVRAARLAGVRPVLVDVLADRHQPEVARLRAFGAVATALAAATGAIEALAPDARPAVAPAA